MAVYTGAVIPITDDDTAIGVVSDDDFPFLAIVSDWPAPRLDTKGYVRLRPLVASVWAGWSAA